MTLRSLICGLLRSHDLYKHYEVDRICLRCLCGYESPGIVLRASERSIRGSSRVIRFRETTSTRRIA